MSYRITYKDKSGVTRETTKHNSFADAKGWQEILHKENGGRVILEHIADGPYDYSGKKEHISTIGDN